jgi:predicted amidohydrolase
MDPLVVAVWQTAHPATPNEALQRLDAAAARAAAAGAHWLVTPEMFLSGYLIEPALLAERAQSLDGAWVQAATAIARRHRVGLVTGLPEARPHERPFNTAIAIDAAGRRVAAHRKVHLFGAGDAARFSAGEAGATLFESRGRTIGLLICYDVEHDEPLQRLAQRGADAVLVPTANMVGFDEVQRQWLPDAARRHGLAVVYANACGAEGETAYNGLSTVCAADGRVLWQGGHEEVLQTVALKPRIR